MKHLKIYIAFTLLISVLLSASAVESDLIATHRKWVADRFGHPDQLDPQERIQEAVLVVADAMREPEAMALLEHVAIDVPALKGYLKWLRSNKPDPLLKHSTEALGALKDYAVSQWPGSWTAARCQTAYLTYCGNVRDVDAEWDKVIAEYSGADNADSNLIRGLLPMMKAIRFCQLTCRRNYDDVAEYPEVFAIEEEGLSAYPPYDAENSLQKAEVYYWLGEMKAMLHHDLAVALYQSEAQFNTFTTFMPIGNGSRNPNNTLWYFTRAAETAASALSPGHPFVRSVNRSRINFEANVKASTPDMQKQFEEDFEYVRAYYPGNSIERATAEIMWYIRCMQNGITPPDNISVKDYMDVLEKSLGVKNPIYHQHLIQAATAFLYIDPDDQYWFDRVTSTLEKAGYNESDDNLLFMLSQIFQPMHAVNPQQALDSMEAVLEEYLENQSSKPLSILTGLSLADFYLYYVFDNLKGRTLLTNLLIDLTTPFSIEQLSNPLYWDVCLRLALNPDQTDTEFSDSYFDKMLDLLEGIDVKGKNLLKYYFLSAHAIYRGTTFRDFEGAEAISRNYEGLVAPWMNDVILEALTHQAFYKYASGEPFENTEPIIQKAIATYNSAPKESLRPVNVQNIGGHYYNYGRFPEALEWYEKALDLYRIKEGEHAFTHDYHSLRQDLAATLETLGRYSEARMILDETTDALSESFGVTPTPDLLRALWQDYVTLQQDNAADFGSLVPRLYQIIDLTNQLYIASGYDIEIRNTLVLREVCESIFMISLNFDENYIHRANLSGDSQAQSNLAKIETMVDMLEQWLGEIRESNPNYEVDLYYHNAVNTLSSYYSNVKNDPGKALELMKPYLKGDLSFDNAGDYRNAMNLAWEAGNTAEAIGYADFLESGLHKVRGAESGFKDDLTQFRLRQYIESGEYANAVPYARDYFARHKEMLDGNFKLMTKLQQENYMTTYGDPADPIAGLLEYLPDELSSETYDAILYRTGMQLRSHRATRDLINQSGRPDLKAMLDSVEYIQMERTKLNNWASSNPEESMAHARQVGELQHKSTRLERRLLAELKEMGTHALEDISWTQVRDCLQSDEAAVEFLFSNKHIHALVLRKGDDTPRVVRLCEFDELDNLLNSLAARNSASRAKRLYQPDEHTLYQLLWQPLESQLNGATTVYYSIPGILSTLAFNAFATPDGDTLFDRYRLVQLTTTGQLVFGQPESTPERIAIMADILYDENQTPISPEDPGSRDIDDDFDFSADSGDPDSSRALKKSHFRHLPFTAIEMEEISRAFQAASVDSVRRLEASEPMLRKMVEKRPEILHLATHGYYISSESDIKRYPFLQAKGAGNMQRSGIALAGAEKTWTGKSDAPDDSDGILTASEVASLDLSDTSLVALSACETALGDFSFEGIFGLQRGFKQAGAKSLLVSLWSVNDHSTSLFMSEFYSRLRSGDTRFDAWRKAVERVRRDYPEPYYWAPFILLDAV